MVWAAYHHRGEGAPRIDIVSRGVVGVSYTMNDIADAAVFPIDAMMPTVEERFNEDVEIRKLIDGAKQPIKGGFYYEAKLRFPVVDKTNASVLLGIINHCATPGDNYVHFYPHSDVTTIYYKAYITGEVSDFDEFGRPLVIGHSATIEVTGLDPFPNIPSDQDMIMMVWKNGEAYDPAETDNMMVWENGAAYDATELVDTLGYVLRNNDRVSFSP